MGRPVQRRICKEHGSRRGHSCERAQGLRLRLVRRDDALDGLDLGWPVPCSPRRACSLFFVCAEGSSYGHGGLPRCIRSSFRNRSYLRMRFENNSREPRPSLSAVRKAFKTIAGVHGTRTTTRSAVGSGCTLTIRAPLDPVTGTRSRLPSLPTAPRASVRLSAFANIVGMHRNPRPKYG
jgi:hypothetical protein